MRLRIAEACRELFLLLDHLDVLTNESLNLDRQVFPERQPHDQWHCPQGPQEKTAAGEGFSQKTFKAAKNEQTSDASVRAPPP